MGNVMYDYLAVAFYGLVVGSFLNVLIHRMPQILKQEVDQYVAEMTSQPFNEEKINYMGRSKCPTCKKVIPWYQNIPVLSYLFLRGKCSKCGVKISPRYSVVEAIGAISAVGIVYHYGFGLEAGLLFIAFMLMLAMSCIDSDHLILPDGLVLSLLVAGLASQIYVMDGVELVSTMESMVIVFCAMSLFRGAMSRVYGREVVGFGDIKLLTAFCAWMPAFMLLWVVLIGSVLLILIDKLSKKRESDEYPFGPYLCFGAIVAYFFQSSLTALVF